MENKIELPGKFQIDPALFYDAVVKSTDDYIYIVDMQTDAALISENMQRDFALPGRIVNGLIPTWGGRIHERDKARYFESVDQMVAGVTNEHNLEYQIRNNRNEYIWVMCRGYLQRDENGKPLMFAGVVTNLSSKGRVDTITGLFSQQNCMCLINNLLKKGDDAAGFLLLGLDNFSSINNLKDHNFGDCVLRQFAQEVQQIIPAQASMYRFDGDEFAIICPHASRQTMAGIYKKIRDYSNQKHTIDNMVYYCSVSGGIVMIGQDCKNDTDVIKCATSALEASKSRGKNTYTVYTPGLLFPKLRSLEILNQLRASVLNDMEGFYLVYQPLTDAQSLKVHGAETLLRWSSSLLGQISPAEFIPLLETSGLIVPVGKWVLEQAVCQCKKWVAHCKDFILNVNVSYLQMMDESFIQFVIDVLKKYDLAPAHIVLEMTESRFVTDMGTLRESFDRLRESNIRLAMDDFGTGYSSLGILSNTPADIVKIDRTFITSIDDNAHMFNRSFIGAVIQLCHSVGISVCVEGVERQNELNVVRSLNADSIQGFYISKPVMPEEFEKKYCPDGRANLNFIK